ncbi:MAG TPA: hypothetical protein VE085_08295 [Burkholderiales bacterium]|nr:hypothetical protein [Burkholderiales bacterium]
MPRRGKKTSSQKAKRTMERSPATPKDEAPVPENSAPVQGRVIEHPDGFYWQAKKGEPHGPFTTLAEAEADMLSDGAGDEEVEPAEGLQEAESELGINEWIDPDTGGPAEDNVPRIEDH